MQITLDENDIIKELEENHLDDPELLLTIIDKTTTSWEPVKEVVKIALNMHKHLFSQELHYLLTEEVGRQWLEENI